MLTQAVNQNLNQITFMNSLMVKRPLMESMSKNNIIDCTASNAYDLSLHDLNIFVKQWSICNPEG